MFRKRIYSSSGLGSLLMYKVQLRKRSASFRRYQVQHIIRGDYLSATHINNKYVSIPVYRMRFGYLSNQSVTKEHIRVQITRRKVCTNHVQEVVRLLYVQLTTWYSRNIPFQMTTPTNTSNSIIYWPISSYFLRALARKFIRCFSMPRLLTMSNELRDGPSRTPPVVIEVHGLPWHPAIATRTIYNLQYGYPGRVVYPISGAGGEDDNGNVKDSRMMAMNFLSDLGMGLRGHMDKFYWLADRIYSNYRVR